MLLLFMQVLYPGQDKASQVTKLAKVLRIRTTELLAASEIDVEARD